MCEITSLALIFCDLMQHFRQIKNVFKLVVKSFAIFFMYRPSLRNLSLILFLLIFRVLAPKCAACDQPILPSEVRHFLRLALCKILLVWLWKSLCRTEGINLGFESIHVSLNQLALYLSQVSKSYNTAWRFLVCINWPNKAPYWDLYNLNETLSRRCRSTF